MGKVSPQVNYNLALLSWDFSDGENAQMPVVMGVLRTRKGEQSTDKQFLFTGQDKKL